MNNTISNESGAYVAAFLLHETTKVKDGSMKQLISWKHHLNVTVQAVANQAPASQGFIVTLWCFNSQLDVCVTFMYMCNMSNT